MALIACKECSGQVSETAATCPHCGAPVAVADKHKNGSAWPWLIGLPIGLAILAMLATAPMSPEQRSDKNLYKHCLSDLESLDRARSPVAAIKADLCERFRADYIKKWGSTP